MGNPNDENRMTTPEAGARTSVSAGSAQPGIQASTAWPGMVSAVSARWELAGRAWVLVLACLALVPRPLLAQAPARTAEGFALPQAGHAYSFPRDHGSHPEFKIEWWYVTGHLWAEDGKRFGYQATFFRNASPDRSVQIYLAHMALIDVSTGRFYHQERLNREGWDAGAAVGALALHNGPWSLKAESADSEEMHLRGGVRAEVQFDLRLRPEKPHVIFGEDGVSRKGTDPTAASYYITFTRLAAAGTLRVDGKEHRVTGQSWMDHEISSSQLSRNQVGWDWVSIQLKDGREVMFYRLRQADGSSDPASRLTWIDRQGGLQTGSFRWEVVESWRSPTTGATYPATVRLRSRDPQSGEESVFLLEPLVADQELSGDLAGIAYWEGACRVRNAAGQEIGSAYMELTGYAEALKLQ